MVFLPFDRRINDRIPWLIFVLMSINLSITVHTYFGFDESRIVAIFRQWGAIPTALRPETWVTHMFLHAGPAHVIGNMAFLVLFGMNVERRIGAPATLLLYLLSGFAALILFVFFNPGFGEPLVGASGAVSGVVGMHLVLFRRRTVEVMWYAFVAVGMVRLPAMIVAAFWIGLELLQAVLLNDKVMVAHWAHVGGFAGGFGLTPLLMRFHRGHPEVYATETKRRTRDRFEEKFYIPEPPAPNAAGLRLVAREWRPVTAAIRRIVDGVAPGSGAFARPSRVAGALAVPQAEDLRGRLDRAGYPASILPQEREVPETPFIFIERLERTADGLILVEAGGARREIEWKSVVRIQAAKVQGKTFILDIVARDPWRRFRLSSATSSMPVEEILKTLTGVEESKESFASLPEVDEYFRWRLMC